jgi:RES domain
MPVYPDLTTKVQPLTSYYRITSDMFRTPDSRLHVKVVNGEGGRLNKLGSRYSGKGTRAVYLAEDIETCLAEKMFYFHRETLNKMDIRRFVGIMPNFYLDCTLWEIEFLSPIPHIIDLTKDAAHTAFDIMPCMFKNPSQDYEHLKDKRADIEIDGYKGLRAKSSRSTKDGYMIVLFEDVSGNVAKITPYGLRFHLIKPTDASFSNPAMDELDYTRGAVSLTDTSVVPPIHLTPYISRQIVSFHH